MVMRLTVRMTTMKVFIHDGIDDGDTDDAAAAVAVVDDDDDV